MREPSTQTNNLLCATDPSKKVPSFFLALPPQPSNLDLSCAVNKLQNTAGLIFLSPYLMKIKLDVGKLDKAIDNAWAEVVARVDTECIAVIEDPNEFSDLGFDQQDIVLSGRLRNSQVVDVQGNKAEFTWNPHDPETGYAYAIALFFGFFAYGGHKFIPGRKWVFRALRRIDPVVLLAEELQKQGIGARVIRNDVELLP